MNSLGSYSGGCSGSCLQRTWRFKGLPFAGPCWKPSAFPEVFDALADSVSSSRSSTSKIVTRLKEACPFPLIFSFEVELTSQLVMTRFCLLTLREPSLVISKVEMRFMHEATELWTSFTSPKWLNMEYCVSGHLCLWHVTKANPWCHNFITLCCAPFFMHHWAHKVLR